MDGGRVQVNGERVKASRHVKIGDRLRISRERELFEVDVTGIPKRRGPGAEAGLITAKRRKARLRGRTPVS